MYSVPEEYAGVAVNPRVHYQGLAVGVRLLCLAGVVVRWFGGGVVCLHMGSPLVLRLVLHV